MHRKTKFSIHTLAGIVSIIAVAQPALAGILKSDQSMTFAPSAWYVTRGAFSQDNKNTLKLSADAYAHITLSSFVIPGEEYTLNAPQITGAGVGSQLALQAYDANWKPIANSTIIPASGANNKVTILLPSNSAVLRAQLTTDKRYKDIISLGSVSLTRSVTKNAAKLRYAPPALVNPTTIELSNGTTTSMLDTTKDYILKLPKTKKVGTTWVNGGHNIVIIGGYITLPKTNDLSNKAISRALYFKGATGTVHVEGVLIDGSGGGMSDGIVIAAPEATVQVQNVRVDGIYGYNSQFHADVIQPYGGVKKLLVDKLTGYSGYQGLQVNSDLGPNGSMSFSRVNLVSTGKQLWNSNTPVTGGNGGALVWLINANNCKSAFPVTFDNVYIQPRAELGLGKAVWPPAQVSDIACASVLSSDGNNVSFPKLPVTGFIKKGIPPQGDFVPTGIAGLNYISPGYQ